MIRVGNPFNYYHCVFNDPKTCPRVTCSCFSWSIFVVAAEQDPTKPVQWHCGTWCLTTIHWPCIRRVIVQICTRDRDLIPGIPRITSRHPLRNCSLLELRQLLETQMPTAVWVHSPRCIIRTCSIKAPVRTGTPRVSLHRRR